MDSICLKCRQTYFGKRCVRCNLLWGFEQQEVLTELLNGEMQACDVVLGPLAISKYEEKNMQLKIDCTSFESILPLFHISNDLRILVNAIEYEGLLEQIEQWYVVAHVEKQQELRCTLYATNFKDTQEQVHPYFVTKTKLYRSMLSIQQAKQEEYTIFTHEASIAALVVVDKQNIYFTDKQGLYRIEDEGEHTCLLLYTDLEKSPLFTVLQQLDHEHLLIGLNNGAILIWHMPTKQITERLLGSTQAVIAIVKVSEHYFVTTHLDGKIQLWDAVNRTLVWVVKRKKPVAVIAQVEESLIVGDMAGYVSILAVADGLEQRTWQAHTKAIRALAVSEDNTLVVGGYDCVLTHWSMTGEALTCGIMSHTHFIMGVQFVTSAIAVTAGKDGHIKYWDVKKGQLLHMMNAHAGTIQQLVYKNGLLYSCGDDGTIVVQNTQIEKQHQLFIGKLASDVQTDLIVANAQQPDLLDDEPEEQFTIQSIIDFEPI